MTIFKKISDNFLYITIGGLFGFTLYQLGIPAGLMLGAVIGTITIKLIFNSSYHIPRQFTTIAELFLGISLGLNISIGLITEMGKLFPIIITFIFISLICSTLAGYYLYRKQILDLPTALYAMVPGAAFQMAVLGKEQGGSYEIIGSVHILRMLLVIVTPIMIGFWLNENQLAEEKMYLFDFQLNLLQVLLLVVATLGSFIAIKLKVPVGIIIGSMTSAAILQSFIGNINPLEGIYTFYTQIIIGVAVGASVSRKTINTLTTILLPTLIVIISIIGLGLGLSCIFVLLTNVDYITALFSFAPGGLTEMTIAAKVLGGEGVFVATIHIIRLLIIFLLVPRLLIWIINKEKTKSMEN